VPTEVLRPVPLSVPTEVLSPVPLSVPRADVPTADVLELDGLQAANISIPTRAGNMSQLILRLSFTTDIYLFSLFSYANTKYHV